MQDTLCLCQCRQCGSRSNNKNCLWKWVAPPFACPRYWANSLLCHRHTFQLFMRFAFVLVYGFLFSVLGFVFNLGMRFNKTSLIFPITCRTAAQKSNARCTVSIPRACFWAGRAFSTSSKALCLLPLLPLSLSLFFSLGQNVAFINSIPAIPSPRILLLMMFNKTAACCWVHVGFHLWPSMTLGPLLICGWFLLILPCSSWSLYVWAVSCYLEPLTRSALHIL